MPEPLVVQSIRNFRLQLLAQERTHMDEMVQRWLDVERVLEGQIEALARAVAEGAAGGQGASIWQVQRMERYQILLRLAQAEIARYTLDAERAIVAGQRQMAALGVGHARQALRISAPEGIFNHLPTAATERMVGLVADGSPLRTLLANALPDAVQGLTDELVRATALGRNPRETARRMVRQGLSRGLNRVLTISRTEQLRVYRESSRMQYEASGVVSGYKRISARDGRVCIGCLAADGTLYPLDVPFAAHPQCRCSLVPLVRGAEMPAWEDREVWFRRQSPETQRQIMGPGRHELWARGAVPFERFFTVRENATWGDAVVPTPVGALAA